MPGPSYRSRKWTQQHPQPKPARKPFTFDSKPTPKLYTSIKRGRLDSGYSPRQRQDFERKKAEANVISTFNKAPFRAAPGRVSKQSMAAYALRYPRQGFSQSLLSQIGGQSEAKKLLLKEDLGKGVFSSATKDALKGVYKVVKTGVDMTTNTRPLQASGNLAGIPIATGNVAGPTKAAGVVGGTALGTAEALYRNPKKDGKSFRQKTVEDVGTLPEAIIGGLGQVAYDTGKGVVEGDYLRGPKNLAKGMASDYSGRYKPLVKGDYRGFEKQLEGRGSALPEVLDLTTLATAGGVTLGRAAGAAARRGALGARAEKFATAPRPKLRVSGGRVKEQEVSKNLFRLAGQRLEDVRRTRQNDRYVRKATEKGAGVEGLLPGKGEVVALRSPIPGLGKLINNQRRLGNKEQGRISSEATTRMDAAKNFVTKTIRDSQRNLDGNERAAFPLATQGVLPLLDDGYDIGRSVEALKRYRADLLEERKAAELEALRIEQETGKSASKSTVALANSAISRLKDRMDSIRMIDRILENPEKHLTPALAREAQVVMDKLGPLDAGVLEGTALRRKARPQAEFMQYLKPSISEVERGLPPRQVPTSRPMTTREIADSLEPHDVPVEAFDKAASRKAVERRRRKSEPTQERPAGEVSPGEKPTAVDPDEVSFKTGKRVPKKPTASDRGYYKIEAARGWTVADEIKSGEAGISVADKVLGYIKWRRSTLAKSKIPAKTIRLPKSIAAAVKRVKEAPIGSELYHPGTNILVRKTAEGWERIKGAPEKRTPGDLGRVFPEKSIEITFKGNFGGGSAGWHLTTFGGSKSKTAMKSLDEVEAEWKQERVESKKRIADAEEVLRKHEKENASGEIETVRKPKPRTASEPQSFPFGTGKSTRPETPAEMLRRAKEMRDRPTVEDVRPETPAERRARAERKRDIVFGKPPVDKAEQIRSEIKALRSEKKSPERDERIRELEDDLVANEQTYYRRFAEDVAKQAESLGLPVNPVYFRHAGLTREAFHVYTTGPAIRYFDDLARSNLVLFKLGLYDLSPQAFEKGLMATVKRGALIRGISENIDTLALKVVGDKRVPTDLNLNELQRWMATEGLNIDGYFFFNPKRALSDDVLGSGDSSFFADPAELLEGKKARTITGLGPDVEAMVRTSPRAGEDTKGWYAVPKDAGGSSLLKDAKESSALGRGYDRYVRGLGSAVILGTSPAWLMMQRIVDAYGLTAASRFNPVKIARSIATYPMTWHSLTPQMQEAIKARIGAGYHRRTPKMGKAGKDMVGRGPVAQQLLSMWDELSRTKAARGVARAPGVLFDLDNWFTSHTKRIRYLSKAEEIAAKQRYEALRESVGAANASLDRVMAVLRKPPAKQIEDALKDSKVFDEAADHIHRAFGDWNNLSGAERHGAARLPMFYTWLRFAGRTLFHTLPVRHPLLLATTLEIAKAHKEAMDEHYRESGALLPGEELPSYSYSRIFREDGKVTDLGRISPVVALPLDLGQMALSVLTGSEIGRGPKTFLTSLPPAITSVLEAFLGTELLTNKKLQVGTSTRSKGPYQEGGLPTVGKVAFNRFMSANPIYGALMLLLGDGKPVSADSLPWNVKKVEYATEQGQSGAEEALKAKGSPAERALQRTVFPLAAMSDSMPTTLATIRSKQGGKPKSLSDEFRSWKSQGTKSSVADEYQQWRKSSKKSSVADEYRQWKSGN